MNEIVNKLLLVGDKFMLEMHLRKPGFTCSPGGPFTEKQKNKNLKKNKTGDARYIYQKELEKACFEHGIAYGDFKDLTRRTDSNKILYDKAFNIAKKSKI